ncbi:hypothetical protein EDB85DRAFT_1891312 [Lactarius pseudohatsudake]|nr:hypothetical protein EDB85DRAFT_1891312 [Lactarius pseudohatsudake]
MFTSLYIKIPTPFDCDWKQLTTPSQRRSDKHTKKTNTDSSKISSRSPGPSPSFLRLAVAPLSDFTVLSPYWDALPYVHAREKEWREANTKAVTPAGTIQDKLDIWRERRSAPYQAYIVMFTWRRYPAKLHSPAPARPPSPSLTSCHLAAMLFPEAKFSSVAHEELQMHRYYRARNKDDNDVKIQRENAPWQHIHRGSTAGSISIDTRHFEYISGLPKLVERSAVGHSLIVWKRYMNVHRVRGCVGLELLRLRADAAHKIQGSRDEAAVQGREAIEVVAQERPDHAQAAVPTAAYALPYAYALGVGQLTNLPHNVATSPPPSHHHPTTLSAHSILDLLICAHCLPENHHYPLFQVDRLASPKFDTGSKPVAAAFALHYMGVRHPVTARKAHHDATSQCHHNTARRRVKSHCNINCDRATTTATLRQPCTDNNRRRWDVAGHKVGPTYYI